MSTRKSLTSAAIFALILTAVAVGAPRSAPDDPVIAAMDEAIQDEYRSQQTYRKVIETFGEVLPFSNIVEAETRHIAHLTELYTRRGLTPPESRWNRENVPGYESVEAACAAAVRAETENVAMYDRLLALELPDDVRRVFEYLRAASAENHLPAFRRCGGAR